ncbi:ferritin-like domain-containing protein [Intrasporangium calvum]|uniref:Ferritin-like domain-containing protein n=1 Tax=Intrasporangium calvum TaxID=53358 RepID=A0ABT5GK71_9MICO|nr:ferritin-like fold-containing protein [Intrasporangium calvum]MDC5698614.1 ferritin-like domain-containing protein [Intrasporangium calvum]
MSDVAPERSHPDRDLSDLSDPDYREAVVDLLGALAYGELRAFAQLAKDSELAPTLGHRSAHATLAAHELRNFTLLTDRLRALDADPEQAMEPFVEAVDSFHARTASSDWLEGLVKAYVGEGIAQDFYREISSYVDPDTRSLVLTVLEDQGQADFAVSAVRAAIEEDARIAGRLALWGRRLVGEAITQAQRVGVERDALASLLVGAPGRSGADLAELGRMFVRLTDEHTKRMDRLGLSA